MRKLFTLIWLLSFVWQLSAQVDKARNLTSFDYKTLHWGFTVGLNAMDFAVQRNPDALDYKHVDIAGFQPAGFQVNIVSDLRLSDDWNLRFLPGINIGSRRISYYTESASYAFNNDESFVVNSAFLDFPLLLKYRAERVNNYRPYVIGGLSFRQDMSSRKRIVEDKSDFPALLRKGDFYLEGGFGIDTYSQYFKFAPELKVCVGLRNMLDDSVYPGDHNFVESIKHMRSFVVMLNFHFE